jgi:hypothetical protein
MHLGFQIMLLARCDASVWLLILSRVFVMAWALPL